MKMVAEEVLYIRSMGKALRVTAMFLSDDEANAYMAKNKDEGVVAVFEGRVYLANLYDKGVKIAA